MTFSASCLQYLWVCLSIKTATLFPPQGEVCCVVSPYW